MDSFTKEHYIIYIFITCYLFIKLSY